VKSLLYNGAFPVDFLRRDEAVRLANPEHGSCELMSPRYGAIRIELGEIVERTQSGGISIRRSEPTTEAVGTGQEVVA
jgi:hypothetical protein